MECFHFHSTSVCPQETNPALLFVTYESALLILLSSAYSPEEEDGDSSGSSGGCTALSRLACFRCKAAALWLWANS